jgi:hypothetical protein
VSRSEGRRRRAPEVSLVVPLTVVKGLEPVLKTVAL